MIETLWICGETGFNVAEAVAHGELRENHGEKLVETGKRLDLVPATVALYQSVEPPYRQVTCELGENGFPRVCRHKILGHWKTHRICTIAKKELARLT